jgi:hypothetical protein
MAGMGPKSRISADMERGKALNIGSTPTVFINNKSVPYPDMIVPTMQKLIEDAITESQGGQASQAKSAPPLSTPAASNSNK